MKYLIPLLFILGCQEKVKTKTFVICSVSGEKIYSGTVSNFDPYHTGGAWTFQDEQTGARISVRADCMAAEFKEK